MLTTTSSSRMSGVPWLIESQPPSLTWARPSPQQSNQPPLELIDHEFDHAEDTAANHRGVRVSTVKALLAARPRPGLPDAQEWSTTLALAVIQALVARLRFTVFMPEDGSLMRPSPNGYLRQSGP